jgi:hypothetical protein
MERYYNDSDFRKLISQTIISHDKIINSLSFTHYEGISHLYEKYNSNIESFIQQFNDCFCEKEFLDAIHRALSKSKRLSCIKFLFDLVSFVNDSEKLIIVQYILERFSIDELMKYKSQFHMKFQDPSMEMKYIDLFCDSKYQMFHNDLHVEDGGQLLHKYMETRTRLKEIEKENEKLKEIIKEKELEIKYIPGGEGYMEAKKEFEALVIDQSRLLIRRTTTKGRKETLI